MRLETGSGLLILVLAVGAMGAAGFEIWLAMRDHPRRWLYAWAAWTPLAMLVVAAVQWDDGPLSAVVTGLVVGPLMYPVFAGLIWLRFHSFSASQAEEAAKDLERMRYQATDFGGVREAPPEAAPEARQAWDARATNAPMVAPLGPSRLSKATTHPLPAWAQGTEILVIVGVVAVGLALWVAGMVGDLRSGRGPTDGELVSAMLEMNGFAAPHMDPDVTGADCETSYDGAWRWSAMGGMGRACVSARTGAVSLWVDRRWSRDLGASTAAAAVVGVEPGR